MVAIIRSAWFSSTTWNGNRPYTWPAACQRVPLESKHTSGRSHKQTSDGIAAGDGRAAGCAEAWAARVVRASVRRVLLCAWRRARAGLSLAMPRQATVRLCVSRVSATHTVCAGACVCCWGRVQGRGCFLPQTVRSDDCHRVLRIELHSRVLLARTNACARAHAHTKTARAQRRRTFLTSTSGLCMRPTYTAQSQGLPQRKESNPPTNEQTLSKCFRDWNGDLSFTVAEP